MKSPFETPVSGVTFRPGYPKNLWDIAGAMVEVFGKDSKPTLVAWLVREPDNKHDPNAIKVFVGGERAGPSNGRWRTVERSGRPSGRFPR